MLRTLLMELNSLYAMLLLMGTWAVISCQNCFLDIRFWTVGRDSHVRSCLVTVFRWNLLKSQCWHLNSLLTRWILRCLLMFLLFVAVNWHWSQAYLGLRILICLVVVFIGSMNSHSLSSSSSSPIMKEVTVWQIMDTRLMKSAGGEGLRWGDGGGWDVLRGGDGLLDPARTAAGWTPRGGDCRPATSTTSAGTPWSWGLCLFLTCSTKCLRFL